jgi:hypothetical protein
MCSIGLCVGVKKKMCWPMGLLNLVIEICFLIISNEPIIKCVIGLVGLWKFERINVNGRKGPLFSMFNEIWFV